MNKLEKAIKENDFITIKKLLKKDTNINIRISKELKKTVEPLIKEKGFRGFSEYIEYCFLNLLKEKIEKK